MLASGVVAGTLLGLLVRRSWRPLVSAPIRWFPLLVAGLVARAAASILIGASFPLYVFAIAATAISAWANLRLTGALLIGLGGTLNLLVVLLNGGMPVDPGAIAVAGASMPGDSLHVTLRDTTHLAMLADVIPVAVARAVYSVGDVFIAAGGFIVPFVLLIRR